MNTDESTRVELSIDRGELMAAIEGLRLGLEELDRRHHALYTPEAGQSVSADELESKRNEAVEQLIGARLAMRRLKRAAGLKW